jgi:hypothetical protein
MRAHLISGHYSLALPLEVIFEIVGIHINNTQPVDSSPFNVVMQAPSSVILPVVNTCKAIRHFALPRLFNICTLCETDSIQCRLWKYMYGAQYSRYLSTLPLRSLNDYLTGNTRSVQVICTGRTPFLKQLFLELAGWTKLRALRFDLHAVGAQFSSVGVLDNIHTLEICGNGGPDPMLVSGIPFAFPGIHELVLRMNLTWCGLCYLPVRLYCDPKFKSGELVYENGLGLPVVTFHTPHLPHVAHKIHRSTLGVRFQCSSTSIL